LRGGFLCFHFLIHGYILQFFRDYDNGGCIAIFWTSKESGLGYLNYPLLQVLSQENRLLVAEEECVL